MRKLLKWWRTWWARPVVMERVMEMSEEDLAQAFASAASTPLWKAVMQVIDQKIVQASNDALDGHAPEAQLRTASGSGMALLDLKQELIERQQLARRQVGEKEQKG